MANMILALLYPLTVLMALTQSASAISYDEVATAVRSKICPPNPQRVAVPSIEKVCGPIPDSAAKHSRWMACSEDLRKKQDVVASYNKMVSACSKTQRKEENPWAARAGKAKERNSKRTDIDRANSQDFSREVETVVRKSEEYQRKEHLKRVQEEERATALAREAEKQRAAELRKFLQDEERRRQQAPARRAIQSEKSDESLPAKFRGKSRIWCARDGMYLYGPLGNHDGYCGKVNAAGQTTNCYSNIDVAKGSCG